MARLMRFAPVVLKNLFSKPVTKNYPAEPIQFVDGSRGHIEIEIDKCISCRLCQINCPSGAITVSKKDYTWAINRFDCVQCGYCVSKCPKKCLSIVPGYQEPEFGKSVTTFRKSDEAIAAILKAEEAKKAKAAAAKKAAAEKKAAEAAAKAASSGAGV